jgi:phosphoserine phosphatase RsbU/P
MYLSLFYGVLDLAHGRLDYANAGHPQAYRVDGEGCFTRLGATGTPLGTLSHEPYDEVSTSWNHGDMLVLFTDGLSDSLADRLGSMSGETHLVERVIARRDEPLEHVVDAIFTESDGQPTDQPDDRTLLLVRG